MKSNLKFFKKFKSLPVDKFFYNVLYDKKDGYYSVQDPFGSKGDFLTSPKISKLFSEMIAIWIIYTWEIFGKPKNFNIIELGPGDGDLIKVILKVFKKFPYFNSVKKIYLYEESNFLKKLQKKTLKSEKVEWISNFNKIKKGPVVFFGNEFLDALPIKQFKKEKNNLYEKYLILDKKKKIKEVYFHASASDLKVISSFKTLKNLKFIEFPKMGFNELGKVVQKVSKLNGCILIIDYGYLKPNNQNTLQSVYKHKKNKLFDNLGKADVTSHVNFALLKEFYTKNNLKVKKTITQGKFLKKMGIIKRAEIVEKKMKFDEKTNLYYRLKRLLSSRSMGDLFKVSLAYKFKSNKYQI